MDKIIVFADGGLILSHLKKKLLQLSGKNLNYLLQKNGGRYTLE